MRIRQIAVRNWRHFENLDLQLPDHARLVCIVGANGTGKSHLLELISACAHHLGLAPGIEIPRGDPFSDPHDFVLQFRLPPGVSEAVDVDLRNDQSYEMWDRTLTVESCRDETGSRTRVYAGGEIANNLREQFASTVIARLRRSADVHFLSLDADRAYPKKAINVHEIAQAYEIEWEGEEYTKGRSFRSSSTLYDEWIKYFLAQENQSGTRLIQATRRARAEGVAPPQFEDHFESYTAALQKVLPHLVFSGVDSKRRLLLFDTTGLELSFNQLSGGEREIAFLIGQIDRFGLRQGLFLLDEPELHLNADLIRSWVAYLTGTVESGQVWLATHSLEAVEAAGQEATFVLERNDETRRVDRMARLDRRPVLSALSRAVGTPAFSISQLRFVFVEGEDGVGERERFHRITAAPQSVRFMECGSCNEVIRRVGTVRGLAAETHEEIRIGGIVDRDFRREADAQRLSNDTGVFVLPVHELENFFLHPATLSRLVEMNGLKELDAAEVIRAVSDSRAGSWVFQYAMTIRPALNLPEVARPAKELAKSRTWPQFEEDPQRVCREIVGLAGFDTEAARTFLRLLDVARRVYARKREEAHWWRECEGKQVLQAVARTVGYADAGMLSQASIAAWQRHPGDVPEELRSLRAYVNEL